MNESFATDKILRVGRDTINLTWLQIAVQTNVICFIFEAYLLVALLNFCKGEKPVLWNRNFDDDMTHVNYRRLSGKDGNYKFEINF